MAEQYQKWYSFAMTYYDDIYERAVDNYYLITTADARDIGVPAIELAKLAKRGRLENLARGLYRLSRYVPSKFDSYAIAVARVGDSAYLYGESVLALLELAPTNPDRIFVATPVRVRKKMPEDMRVVLRTEPTPIAHYEGIPCQRAKDAILACRTTVMPERLREAVVRGRAEGYLTTGEFEELQEAFS